MNKNFQSILTLIEESKQLTNEEKKSIAKSIIDADKELEITTFKLDRTEKVKRTTAILLEETIEELEQKRRAVEEQNRDLEIESALERVRTRSMTMVKSDEVMDVAVTVYDELQKLDFKFGAATIIIIDKETGYMEHWLAGFFQRNHIESYAVNNIDHPLHAAQLKAWRKGEKFLSIELSGSALKEYAQETISLTGYKNLPEEEKEMLLANEHAFFNLAFMKHGALMWAPSSASDAQAIILQRFAQVFEQTYTRFLDLQKAEEQAREAQIEAALEKVRSRSLAMHKSEELKEVIQVVYNQFVQLNIPVEHAGFIIDYLECEDMHIWLADQQQGVPSEITIPYFDSPHWNSFREAKAKGETFFANLLPFDLKNKFYQDLFRFIPDLTEEAQQAIFSKPALAISTVLLDNVGLYIEHYSDTPFTAKENAILMRFGKIFEQTYTRFLDLQKAEAQARESQIEAALERVRSRTMAMHKSEELVHVIQAVFGQFQQLGFKLDMANFNYLTKDKDWHMWLATPQIAYPEMIHVPYIDHPLFNKPIETSVKRLDFMSDVLSFEEKNIAMHHFLKTTILKNDSEEIKQYYAESKGLARSIVFMKNISLTISNCEAIPYTDEENSILRRFAKVFEQTYTRFLDLQKAEAQAREAQIQLSLERIRAKAMAMQHSDELSDFLTVVFEQFAVLNLNPVNSQLSLLDIENNRSTFRLTGKKGAALIATQEIDLDASTVWKQKVEELKAGQPNDVDVIHIPFESLPEIAEIFKEILEKLPADECPLPEDYPNGQYVIEGYCKYGYLGYSASRPPSDEEKEITRRIATEFGNVYQRFLDLQKAEAQAREAQIQLSLERIRAKAMSMQHSDELSDFLTVLFEQFDVLNLNPIYCNLTFFDIDNNRSTYRMTGKKGSTLIATQEIDLDASTVWQQEIEEWKEGRPNDVDVLYIPFENIPEIAEIFKEILEKLPEDERPLPEDFPNGQYVIQGFCKYGYLGYSACGPPSDEEKEITRRIATEFGNVYQRFLDLQKAEEQTREAQIEAALERVRSKTMAMHKSEEVLDIANVLYQELKKLGFQFGGVIIILMDETTGDMEHWFSGFDHERYPQAYRVPYFEHPLYEAQLDGWRNGQAYKVIEISGELKKSYDQNMFSRTDYIHFPEQEKQWMQAVESTIFSFAYMKHGALMWGPTPISDNEALILQRFAKVFEQTYTRFLDLQKAEAQSREAQIQLALERIRARTMAMQSSDELAEVSYLLNKQVVDLGIPTWGCAFNIYGEHDSTEWFSNLEGTFPTYKTPRENIFLKYYEAGQRGESLLIEEFGDERIKELYKYFAALNNSGDETINDHVANAPDYQINHMAYFKYGYLLFVTLVPAPEAHDVFKRFAKEFEQTYTRFLDLKKAEAQTREAQIENALEKVRSRTMAMQHSDELKDVASLLFNQVSALGIKTWTAGFNVWSEDNNSYVDYLSIKEGFVEPYTVHTDKAEALRDVGNARKSGVEFHVLFVEGEKVKQLYLALGKLDEKQIEILLQDGVIPSQQYEHFVFGSKVSLMFITYEPVPEAHDIFKRFGKVFEQTYTRFLDLQKAEAQAREAQIEAALEKVRSASLAIHQSKELEKVVVVLFDKLKELGIPFDSAFIYVFEKSKRNIEAWVASNMLPDPLKVNMPYDEEIVNNPIIMDLWHAIEKGEHGLNKSYKEKDKDDYYRYEAKYNKAIIPESVTDLQLQAQSWTTSFAAEKNSIVGFDSWNGHLTTIEDFQILKRFAKVFEQAYIRFLDLQKAEAQTREAQIESALEKVRSHSLAMHKSDELHEVIKVIFEQLINLNFKIDSAQFDLEYKKSDDFDFWTAIPSQPYPFKLNIPYFDHPFLNQKREAKERGVDFSVANYTFEEKNSYFQHLFKHNPQIPEERKKYILNSQGMAISAVLLKTISLWIGNYNGIAFSSEENAVLMRFARVFEQTYTRFLDLQKAEAQGRESQIQLALERVRARTMAMQRSEELPEVAALLFQQVKSLGVPQFQCGFNIFEIDDKECTWYPGSADGDILPPCKIPLTEHPVFMAFNESRKRGDELFVYEKEGEYQAGHYRYMLSLPVLGEMLQNMLDAGIPFPTFQIDHIANFSHGNLLFITATHFPEMHDTFKRFAKVFEQTYTRFLDLQKAESQALEAIKRASVDRVRAEIASMRTTADLERITPIIWSELTTLGVPFIRCGVFIMDEEQQLVQSFLSTPDGNALAAFSQPYNASGETAQIVISWHKKEIYKQHWGEEQFAEFTNSLLQQGAVKSGEKYLIENRPTDLYLHFLPFIQGMLYVGNTALLSDDELQLVQNLADAFSTAYARYEDFNQLEAAKWQIEKTLVDLKLAQTQLIQSEKMASLGELTAGIAHEIQNPLNFVNNFSEVSAEMVDEMNEELAVGNEQLANGNLELAMGNMQIVNEIANDLKQNLIKINHHGNRASSIVKGMLEHSRTSSKEKQLTDINLLADEYLRLSYHGLRAKDKSFNADFQLIKDIHLPKIEVIPQDIGRVLLNLINNAFQAPPTPNGGDKRIIVKTQFLSEADKREVVITVSDNGAGMSKEVQSKIFQPFFTTKPTGQGTGLGLSLAYDIITKGHGGTIEVESEEGVGTEFIVTLPIV